MNEYIKKSEAIKAVEKRKNSPYMQTPLQYGACESIWWAIKELPSADVVELKRGRWIYQFRDSENEEYRCSKCNYPEAYKPNYCPNCGAYMKGGKE